MFEPKMPSRTPSSGDDAGFPPLREVDELTNGAEDDADDLERDYHEDGGGD